MRLHGWSICYLIALATVLSVPMSFARAQDLPSEVSDSVGALSDGQKSQMEQYIARLTPALSRQEDSAALMDAFTKLTRPVARQTASQFFRRAYGDSLGKQLEAIVKDDTSTILARVNALQLAGTIASDAAASTIRAGLNSATPAVRYAAAGAVRKSFETQAIVGRRADLGPQFLGAVEVLETAMGTEKDGPVLGAMLTAAGANPNASLAIQSVMRAVQGHVRASYRSSPTSSATRLQSAIQSAVSRYIQEVSTNSSDRVEVQKSLILTSVMVIKASLKFAKDGSIPADAVADYRGLVSSAENALCVVTEQTQTTVSENFSAGSYADAESALRSLWLEAAGPLCGNPAWGFQTAVFDKLLGP